MWVEGEAKAEKTVAPGGCAPSSAQLQDGPFGGMLSADPRPLTFPASVWRVG